MAAHDNRESSGFGLKVQLRQIVQDVDGSAAQFKHLGFRQPARPSPLVDVAAHSGQRSNRRKLFEDLGRAGIPGMNDVLRPAQRREGLRAQQTVRVRNDAD